MERLKEATHAKLLAQTVEHSDEWFEARRGGIGGSDVAGILGLSRYDSPLSIWMSKVDYASAVPEDPVSIPARIGTALEQTIIELFAETTGLEVGLTKATYQHPEYEWAIANIDGVVFEPSGEVALLECKSVGDRMRDDWREGVPVYYLTQIQHYLWVMDLPRAYVAVLFGKHSFEHFVVERDEGDIRLIREASLAFWEDHVETQTPPELLPQDPAAMDYLLTKYGETDDTEIDLDDEAIAWAEQYERAIEMEKEARSLKSEAGQKLMETIGSARRGRADKLTVTFVRSSRFSEKKARELYPELVEAHCTALDTRAFRAAHKAEYEKSKTLTSGHVRVTRRK